MNDKKRIMLIDNEEALCRMMEAILADNGYAVKAYVRSFEAVEEFRAGEWDLVVSDIKMPGMDGLEVLQKVKAKEPSDTLIDGDYFFDTESLHLVHATYSPSKLVNRAMFKMSEMQMGLTYLPTEAGIWVPTEFTFRMKAKAMWVINVPTVTREIYNEPIVNGGVDDSVFGVSNGK